MIELSFVLATPFVTALLLGLFGHRRGAGQDELIEHLAGVTGLGDMQLDSGVGFKLFQQRLGNGKGAVG